MLSSAAGRSRFRPCSGTTARPPSRSGDWDRRGDGRRRLPRGHRRQRRRVRREPAAHARREPRRDADRPQGRSPTRLAGRLRLERLDVPLTAFVQTELLDERPETIEALWDCGVDVAFHPHSHTHRGRVPAGSRYLSPSSSSPMPCQLPTYNTRQVLQKTLIPDANYI